MKRGGSASTLFALLVLVGAIAAAFSPVFSAQFVNWDDNYNIEDLRARLDDPLHFFHTTGRVDPYQPLAWCSLWLDARIFGLGPGLDAPQSGAFHVTSVVLHALTALAVFALARRLIAHALPNASARALTMAALIAAFVFAVHPLRAESVAWVTERRDVLCGLFFSLAALVWVRSTPRGTPRIVSAPRAGLGVALCALFVALFFVSIRVDGSEPLAWRGPGALGFVGGLLALGCGAWLAAGALGRSARESSALLLVLLLAVLSYLSKGLAVLLPVALLVADAWPLKRLSRDTAAALVIEKVPLFAASLVVGLLASWAQVRAGLTLADWQSHTLGERALQAAYGLCFYVSRTVAPHALTPIHLLPDELSLTQPRFLVCALATLVATVALFRYRRRAPSLVAALLAFVALVAPVLGFSQAGPQIVAERYTYLACLPLAVWIGGAWLDLRERRARRAVDALFAAWSLMLFGATYAQARVWRDSETLWAHALEIDPENVAVLEQLGAYRGIQALSSGDPAQRRRLLEEADELYLRALALDPTPSPTLPFSRAINLLAMDRAPEAVEPLRHYVQQFPDKAPARAHLGAALAGSGRGQEALIELERAVQLDPEYAKGWQFLARVREQSGDRDGAIAAYERVLTLWPDHQPTIARLARLRER